MIYHFLGCSSTQVASRLVLPASTCLWAASLFSVRHCPFLGSAQLSVSYCLCAASVLRHSTSQGRSNRARGAQPVGTWPPRGCAGLQTQLFFLIDFSLFFLLWCSLSFFFGIFRLGPLGPHASCTYVCFVYTADDLNFNNEWAFFYSRQGIFAIPFLK